MSHQRQGRLGRRGFLRYGLFGAAGFVAVYGATGCGAGHTTAALTPTPTSNGEPEGVSSRAVLSTWGEAGVPLVVTGRVFAADGQTPVEGVTLYVYHTDARGHYSELDGNGREPQPRIKGWVRTDREGRYEFRSTRPGGYPGRRDPAHIHVKTYGAGHSERWLTDFLFDDDPRLTEEMRARYRDVGNFSPVMKITRDAGGVVRCARDIRLAET
jgi:protocatechuate 3,4-dioxygenase beta subunit